MRDIFFYVDEAMRRSGVRSERKLCHLIGISDNSITAYRNKGVLPTDDTMVKLARIAQIPEWEALLDLQIWKSENENVKSIWKALQKKIVPVILIALTSACFAGSAPALAAKEVSSYENDTVYYGKLRIKFIKVIKALFQRVNQKALLPA